MANQTKVKLFDQLIERGLMELGEVLQMAKVEFRAWHFEQIKIMSMLWMWHTGE
jgi:hypothetical protein